MSKNTLIHYIELPARDMGSTKKFYENLFGWKFTDYGPDYMSFEESGLGGGFRKTSDPIVNGALVVLYHENLESILESVKYEGGKISQKIFSFPGGRRFHFFDPNGNELAIWSE